jgi:diguanylate cyclase (GGDEF)-like protein
VIRLIKALIKEKLSSELLRQKEQYLYTDPLTSLYNRNYFSSQIEYTLDSLVYPQSFIICDLNNLKLTNDKYGHLIGDLLLKHFAVLLKENCHAESTLIRMGGDEFLIILENTTEVDAVIIIKRMKITSNNYPIIISENEVINVSSAFGCATRYSFNKTFDEMFKIADDEMYEDKKTSKNL